MMNTQENLNIISQLLIVIAAYMFSKTHIMNNLILIEFITIITLAMMFKTMASLQMENYMILYFIVVVVCESMVGLSTMIAMIRTHGNAHLKSLNSLKF